MSDTYDRSLAHWSEGGRREMEAFYAVASKDYRLLVEARDWSGLLSAMPADDRRVLDVACGSGKFPQALTTYGSVEVGQEIQVDLLDPSPFSIEEAARALAPPFVRRDDLCMTLQALDPSRRYPVVWAVHGLYAIPAADLDLAIERFVGAIAPGGVGFIAQARSEAHYLGFYERYLESRDGTPYTSVEQVEASLRGLGVELEIGSLRYDGVVPAGRPEVLEGYLQRCLFDDALSLKDMLEDEAMGPYLRRCRQADGSYAFPQVVSMLFLRP